MGLFFFNGVETMSSKKPKPKMWEKGGPSPSPKGRPRGTGRSISRLRSTLNKLKGLEPKAIDVIESALHNDGDVESPQVNTAKWIITSISTLTRAAIAEESFREEVKDKQQESQEEATGTDNARPLRFRTVMDEE